MAPLEFWQVLYGKELVKFKNNWSITAQMTRHLAEIFLGLRSFNDFAFLLLTRDEAIANSIMLTRELSVSRTKESLKSSRQEHEAPAISSLLNDVDVFSDDLFFVPLVLTAFLNEIRSFLGIMVDYCKDKKDDSFVVTNPLLRLLSNLRSDDSVTNSLIQVTNQIHEEMSFMTKHLEILLKNNPNDEEECKQWLTVATELWNHYKTCLAPRVEIISMIQHDYSTVASKIETVLSSNRKLASELRRYLSQLLFTLETSDVLRFHRELFNQVAIIHLSFLRFYLLSMFHPSVLSRMLIQMLFLLAELMQGVNSCLCLFLFPKSGHDCLIREYQNFRNQMSLLAQKEKIVRRQLDEFKRMKTLKEEFVPLLKKMVRDSSKMWRIIVTTSQIALKQENGPFNIEMNFNTHPFTHPFVQSWGQRQGVKVTLACNDCQQAAKKMPSFYPCIISASRKGVFMRAVNLNEDDALTLGRIWLLVLYAEALQDLNESEKRKQIKQLVDVAIMKQFERNFQGTCTHYSWVIDS